jgi:hypothetical protein
MGAAGAAAQSSARRHIQVERGTTRPAALRWAHPEPSNTPAGSREGHGLGVPPRQHRPSLACPGGAKVGAHTEVQHDRVGACGGKTAGRCPHRRANCSRGPPPDGIANATSSRTYSHMRTLATPTLRETDSPLLRDADRSVRSSSADVKAVATVDARARYPVGRRWGLDRSQARASASRSASGRVPALGRRARRSSRATAWGARGGRFRSCARAEPASAVVVYAGGSASHGSLVRMGLATIRRRTA